MRLALLISGEFREFETAIKSWNFLRYNPDCYFSTWDTTSEINRNLNIHINEPVTKERIHNYLPNCNIIVEEENELLTYNYEKMVYKWKSVINMMIESNKEYDAVILIRPDLFLNINDDRMDYFLQNIEDDILYTLNPANTKLTTFMQDLFFCGKPKEIQKMLSLPSEELKQEHLNIHWWLAVKLKDLYTDVKNADFFHPPIPSTIARSTSKELKDDEMTFYNVDKKAAEWYYKKYNYPSFIKTFTGFSGSKVSLFKNVFPVISTNQFYFIRKEGNIQRNYEKLITLKRQGFDVPNVYYKKDDMIEMEFILGNDVKNFLERSNVNELLEFIETTVSKFRVTRTVKDYTSTYEEFLEPLKNDRFLPFPVEHLLERLPKKLESSLCHGDFTFDNLIYKNGKFYMIDPSTGPFDSWIFDIAKLRQDLDARWFLRNSTNKNSCSIEIKYIRDGLVNLYPEAFDDYLYILMLLRVYKHANNKINEKTFLLRELKRLWK